LSYVPDLAFQAARRPGQRSHNCPVSPGASSHSPRKPILQTSPAEATSPT